MLKIKKTFFLCLLLFYGCSNNQEAREEIKYIRTTNLLENKNSIKEKVDFFENQDTLYATKEIKKNILVFIENNDISSLKKTLLNLNNINFTYKSKKLNTPLFYAIKSNNLEIIKLFIKKGAMVNYKNIDRVTPLHYAVIYSSLDVVKYLISKRAKINVQDKFGRTPLHYTAIKNKFLIKRLLLSKSAKVLKDKYNKTYIEY